MRLTTVSIVFTLVETSLSTNASNAEQRLWQHLFSSYNPYVRPIANSSRPIAVQLRFNIIYIINVIEAEETIALKMYIDQRWRNELLQWKPQEFEGIEKLSVPISQVWLPDLFIVESVSTVVDAKKYPVTLYYTGESVWDPPILLHVLCLLDVTDFPRDTQDCKAEFQSFSFTEQQMTLVGHSMKDNCSREDNAEWDLVSCGFYNNKSVLNSGGSLVRTFDSVHFTYSIRRKPLFYRLTINLPLAIIGQLTIIGQFVPKNNEKLREEKVTLGLTGLLSISVLLTTVADYLPKNPSQFPETGYLILIEMFLVLLSCLCSVVLMHTHARFTHSKQLPPCWLCSVVRLREQRNRLKDQLTLLAERSNWILSERKPAEDSWIFLVAYTEQRLYAMKEQACDDERLDFIKNVFYRVDVMIGMCFASVNVLMCFWYTFFDVKH